MMRKVLTVKGGAKRQGLTVMGKFETITINVNRIRVRSKITIVRIFSSIGIKLLNICP